jgi:4'-phosphopantetheinyl transferase
MENNFKNLDLDEIQVFYTFPELNEDYFYSQKHILSDEEQNNFENIISNKSRLNFLSGRVILRTILSKQLDIPRDSLIFEKSEYGKPFLREKTINFNISHTDGLTIVVFSSKFNIGVDVEKIRENIKFKQIAKRYFSAVEIEIFSSIPSELQNSTFFHIWTLKEAYIKTEGEGLQIPLNSFSMDFQSEKPKISFKSSSENPELYKFYKLNISNSHKCSLCIKTESSKENFNLKIHSFPLNIE